MFAITVRREIYQVIIIASISWAHFKISFYFYLVDK